MPKTITLYTINELSEPAKENALESMRSWPNLFSWESEWLESLTAIQKELNITLGDWEVSLCSPTYFNFDREEAREVMRGRKLKDYDRDYMPTGFCGDCDFWVAFYDQWEMNGDAVAAIEHGLREFFDGWEADWESTYEDAQLLEFAEMNEILFNESGKPASEGIDE